MSEVKQDRLVRESFITGILDNLKKWLPFRKTTESIDFVVGEETKIVFSIAANGEIFYIVEPNSTTLESLQNRLNKVGLQIIETESEFNNLCNNDNLGKLVFLNTTGESYCAGLYSIILDDNKNKVEPKLLSQDIKNELTNFYTKDEVNSYLNNYVSKGEIETFVTEENVQEIVVKKLEEIIKTDDDGNISINLEGYITIDEFNGKLADYVTTTTYDEFVESTASNFQSTNTNIANLDNKLSLQISSLDNTVVKTISLNGTTLKPASGTITLDVVNEIKAEGNTDTALISLGAAKNYVDSKVDTINLSINTLKTEKTSIKLVASDSAASSTNVIYLVGDAKVPKVVINNELHTIGSTIYASVDKYASTTEGGLMSAEDKSKLDEIGALDIETIEAKIAEIEATN